VIASARRPEVLDDCQALGLETVHLDVTDEESIKAARDRVNELTNGKLDILVNNACVYILQARDSM
jgi:1-acylglycerone phosphate reductase